MAYRKDKQRILAGSLNLLPPGDKIADGDSLELANWRVDQAGQLRSRRGMAARSADLAGGTFHTLARFGTSRYGGVGPNLYSGTALTDTVATGFDGAPLGMAAQQGSVWVMNQGKRIRAVGNAANNWGIAAPSTAPTAAAGAVASVTIAEFDSGESWDTFVWQDNQPQGQTTVYDSTNKMSGTDSLTVHADPSGRWQVSQTFTSAMDLRIGSQARDDDRFRMWFYVSDPAAVVGITITLQCSSTGRVSCTAPPSALAQQTNTWNLLEISRGVDPLQIVAQHPEYAALLQQIADAVAAGDAVQAQALQQAQGSLYQQILVNTLAFTDLSAPVGTHPTFDWSAVTGMWVEVTCSSVIDFNLDKAVVVGGVANSLEGDITYFVTFVNDDGHESNPSPASNTVTVSKQSVALSSIPVSADTQVTRRHIYRVGGMIARPLKVDVIWNNTSTTWSDVVPNEQLQVTNVEMPLDHDPPPAAAGVIGPYFGRLVAWNSAAHPQRYWWSNTAQPAYWPGADDDAEGQWEDCGEDGEDLLAVTNHKRALWMYKERSIWRLQGDPQSSDPEQTNANLGIVGPQAVASAGAVDYFVGPEGVYRFNGDFEEKISRKLDPLFKGDWVQINDTYSVPPMNGDYADRCILCYISGRLYLSYPLNATDMATLVYDIEGDRWNQYSLGTSAIAKGFTALHREGQWNTLLSGQTGVGGAVLYELENGDDDAGLPIPVSWQSRYTDQGAPDTDKTYSDLVIDYRTATGTQTPSNLTVSLHFDNGTTAAVGTISSAARTKSTFSLGYGLGLKATNIAVRIEGDVSSTCIVYGVYLHYYLEARRGVSFDTGVFDLGTWRVKSIEAFEIELVAPAQVHWRVFTDMPGNAMAERDSGDLAAHTVRGPVMSLLDPFLDARRGRLVLTSTQPFQVYAVRVRFKPTGLYVDGTTGDVWEPTALVPAVA